MFPGSSGLGESVAELFNSSGTNQNAIYMRLQQEQRVDRIQNQGVKDMPSENGEAANRNSPQYGNEKNKPSATEDPTEVENAWLSRLSKYAGIAGSTGVKLGGL